MLFFIHLLAIHLFVALNSRNSIMVVLLHCVSKTKMWFLLITSKMYMEFQKIFRCQIPKENWGSIWFRYCVGCSRLSLMKLSMNGVVVCQLAFVPKADILSTW